MGEVVKIGGRNFEFELNRSLSSHGRIVVTSRNACTLMFLREMDAEQVNAQTGDNAA